MILPDSSFTPFIPLNFLILIFSTPINQSLRWWFNLYVSSSRHNYSFETLFELHRSFFTFFVKPLYFGMYYLDHIYKSKSIAWWWKHYDNSFLEILKIKEIQSINTLKWMGNSQEDWILVKESQPTTTEGRRNHLFHERVWQLVTPYQTSALKQIQIAWTEYMYICAFNN